MACSRDDLNLGIGLMGSRTIGAIQGDGLLRARKQRRMVMRPLGP